jgi:hypothetical protein
MLRLITFCLVVCLALNSIACQNTQQSAASAAPPRANAGSPRTLGGFKPIEGTTYLMAPISSQPKGEFLSKGNYDNTHNYAFLNTADESAHQLLPTNDYIVAQTVRLPDEGRNEKGPAAVQWFLYFLVKDDTDADRKLTYKDHRTLAVSDAGGWGYTEIIQNVEEVYGHALRDANTLLVIYRSGSKKYVARVDLPNRKVVSTSDLTLQGGDVQ